MQTFDFRLVRDYNDRIVLNLLLEHGKISGADLARITGMQPSTISNILKGLEQKNIIINRGKGGSTSKGGKRPNLWSINGKYAYALGVDVEIRDIAIAILQLDGVIRFNKIYKTGKATNAKELLENINHAIKEALKSNNSIIDKIIGMGVAFAGIVNREDGIVLMTDVIPQENINLISQLEKKYKFPVILENNANSVAIGSKWVGSARGIKNFMTVLLEIDTDVFGMGIGIVLNGDLYHGSTYCAGELTPTLVNMHNILSRILGNIQSSPVLKKYSENINDISMQVLVKAACQGDEVALQFFNILGNHIGKTISPLVALINPERVIIAGDVAEVGQCILDPIKAVFDTEILSLTRECLTLACSTNGRYSTAMGAASVILHEFFRTPVTGLNHAVKI